MNFNDLATSILTSKLIKLQLPVLMAKHKGLQGLTGQSSVIQASQTSTQQSTNNQASGTINAVTPKTEPGADTKPEIKSETTKQAKKHSQLDSGQFTVYARQVLVRQFRVIYCLLVEKQNQTNYRANILTRVTINQIY